MGETFMTAGTKMDDLVAKKNKIMDMAGGLVADAVMGRAKEKGMKRHTMITDIENLIRQFDEKEQNAILKSALYYIASNGSFNSKNSSDTGDNDDYRPSHHSRSGLFGR